ncbi:MAG: hypothetical protein AB7U98_12200 [Candidatus Nitrosocosmicus sp.]
MNKSNIQTNKKQTKNVSLYATISVMVAFALVSSPLIIGTDVYASKINPSIDIIVSCPDPSDLGPFDQIPDHCEINSSNNQKLHTTLLNAKQDEHKQEEFEMEEVIVIGCPSGKVDSNGNCVESEPPAVS